MQSLALNCVANIGGAEFTENLSPDIQKMLTLRGPDNLYVKRKAVICLLRLYRSDPDIFAGEDWSSRVHELFQEKDAGVLLSVAGLMIGVLEQDPAEEWASILLSVVQAMY